MKYKSFNRHDASIYFSSACSKCGRDVDDTDKFCRACGHELSPLPEKIRVEVVCEILTQKAKAGLLEDLQEDDKKTDKEEQPEEPSDWTVSTCKPICPYGKMDPAKCGHCLPSGACDMTVLCSCPPQYNVCPFCGSGYIFCKDAR